ncbi:MAG: tetratricopeptide repeat protein [Chloroflexota bacterium]
MSNLLVQNLKKLFSEDQFGQIIRGLRTDAAVWTAVQDPAITKKMVDLAGPDLSRWTPAFAALTILGFSDLFPKLKTDTFSLDENLKNQALVELEKITTQSNENTYPLPIESAVLAALALRERWLILMQPDISVFKVESNLAAWKSVIACLIGLLPDPASLITDLLNANSPKLHTLAIHGLTTNPAEEEHLSDVFLRAALELSPIARIDILRQCTQLNPKLAEFLAIRLIKQLELGNRPNNNPFDNIQNLVEMSEMLKITGQYEQAIPALENLWQTTTNLQTDLTAQLAQAAAKNKDQDSALLAVEKIAKLADQIPVDASADIALAQIQTGQLDPNNLEIKSIPATNKPETPSALLAKAQLAVKNNQQDQAQTFAAQAYEATIQFLRTKDTLPSDISNTLTPDFLQALIACLIELELAIEASELADSVIAMLPNHAEIVNLFSQAKFLSGETTKSLENAYVASALEPNNPFYRRSLIEMLVKMERWQDSVREADAYLAQLDTPSTADIHLVATCYLHTKQYRDAAIIANRGLALETDSSDLHALLGKIYQQDNKTEKAVKHYNQAILISPQTTEFWSDLAMLYQDQGKVEKAEEILFSAFEVIPNNAHLHLQLGQIHCANNKSTEALAEFNIAHQYVDVETTQETRQEIFTQLGTHLQNQGYRQEALTTLEEGHQAFPVNPKIAHLLGKSLSDDGRDQEALAAFEIASQSKKVTANLLLDHSKALLAVGGKSAEAAEKISQALELEPNNQLCSPLLGEAAAQSGDHHQAINIFQNALQSDLAKDPTWQVKLSTNLANSAFELNQPEIAITFLQESLQKSPDNLLAKQTLCQAFIYTNLNRDAQRLIEEILEQNPQNLEILMWASDQAIKINDLDYASEVLNQAKEIAPQKADIMVRLGYIQLEKGEEAVARETFGQLFSAENVDISNLRLAAQALIGLGDISSSIPYLEKALELSDYKSSDLLRELTILHLQSGNDQAALETVQKQIKIQPMQSSLHVSEADIFCKLSQPNAALNSMLKALKLAPDSAPLHLKTARLQRTNHDLSKSLFHIKRALQADAADPEIQIQAAEVLQACLLDEQALSVTSSLLENEQPSPAALVLRAELLLDQSFEKDQDQIEDLVRMAARLSSSDPKLMALQSRIESLFGDSYRAESIFEQAMLNLSAYDVKELDDLSLSTIKLSLAKAALEMKKWDISIYFSKEAQKLTPNEPAPYLLQVIAYTKRAEAHFRSRAIHMGNPTSVSIARHPITIAAFNQAIESTESFAPAPSANNTLSRWRTRGELALLDKEPGTSIDTLSETPDDFAALLTAFNKAEIVPDIDLSRHHQSAEVIFQRALLNSQLDPEQALTLAETLVQMTPNNPEYAALYAFLAKAVGEDQVALNSIEHAIRLVSGESLWHALAGELHMTFSNYPEAISHFELAQKIDETNPAHSFNLGKAYAANNYYAKAIPALEKAVDQAPLEPEYWISLAKTYQSSEQDDSAIEAVKKALKLAPNSLKIVLSAAEIATQSETESAVGEKLAAKAVSMATQSSVEIIQICELLVKLNQIEQALVYINGKIDLAVEQIPLLIQRAKLIGLQQGSQEKLNLLIELAKENSKNPLIFANLADAYIDTNNPEEAIRSAQFALKYADQSLDLPHRAKLHYQLGVLLRQSGQLDQALHQLTQTLQLTPNFLAAHLEIGETLTQRNEFEKALTHYQTAIEISPNDPRAYKEAGMLLKEGKDYLGAETMFRQAYAHDKNDLFIQRQLAAVIALALIHQPR